MRVRLSRLMFNMALMRLVMLMGCALLNVQLEQQEAHVTHVQRVRRVVHVALVPHIAQEACVSNLQGHSSCPIVYHML